ncbi:TRAP transporter small permease [Sulfitobacter albidus]|uniref:TRAP transporter small permease protein n=1 Tax=Sulfitobacter albidus TaxID=2829501 RepID=A0A975PMW9_9RHOB|nr:TRAP transporter small permease [Sulfitobacter albidus]QUJ76685.1 TRAP transporter small permease [Sulfitobacter albidus]
MLVPLEKILLALGAIAVILLGVLITSNVIARAVFNTFIPDAVIMVRELMVAAILLPLGAATAQRAHVSVAFLTDRFPDRARSWLIVLGSLVGMMALAPLFYKGCLELIKVIERGSFFAGDLDLPKWPGNLFFVLGLGAAWLRLAELFVRDLIVVSRGGIVSDEQQHAGDLMKEGQ